MDDIKNSLCLDLPKVREYILNSSDTSGIYIGCDSQTNKRKTVVSFARVVVVHKDCCKGAKLFGEIFSEKFYGSMRQRLLKEVYYATELALELADVVGKRPFEVHMDINPAEDSGSSCVIKEAIGYVRSMSSYLEAENGVTLISRVKPDAPAASAAADEFARLFSSTYKDKYKIRNISL